MAKHYMGKCACFCRVILCLILCRDTIKCLDSTTYQSNSITQPYSTKVASESTAEPGSEPESTAEPGSEPESTGEPKSKSESTAEPESEPESTAEPESQPEITAEPKSKSESTAEPGSEPESTAEPKSESESTAEPGSEPESTAEPGSEPESTAEPGSEPESTAEPESESESTAEPNSESESEPENEPESEGALPEERPSVVEVVTPPFTMMAFIFFALVGLSIWSKQGSIKQSIKKLSHFLCNLQMPHLRSTGSQVKLIKVTSRISPEITALPETPPLKLPDAGAQIYPNITRESTESRKLFLTPFDREVLKSMGASTNSVRELLRIAAPALLSLALCPATLYLYQPLVATFWPFEKGFDVPPDINEAIACFLAPAGLVYATCFGFAFQQALTKQTEIRIKVAHEIGVLDQITTLASKLTMSKLGDKMDIYKAVKAEAIFMVLQIERKEPTDFINKPTEDVKVKIWSILDILRKIVNCSSSQTFDVDRIIAERIVAHTIELNSICSDRMGTLHARIHPLKWAFLECLGFFSFFGILLLKAESYRVELTMCVITVFSISLMCYVVSDLDAPFSGFFCIDVTVLHNLVHRVKAMYEAAELGVSEPLRYPQTHEMFL